MLTDTPVINIFYNDFWGTPMINNGSHKSYRPFCILTFRLNYFVDGFNPFGYHLVNILLHSVATMLFVSVISLFRKGNFVSLAAGTLFASHTIHTEAVAGVVGRADILACIFFLLSFLSYISYCKRRDVSCSSLNFCSDVPGMSRWSPLVRCAIFTMTAMLCKEQGITVLPVCALYDTFIHTQLAPKQILQLYKVTGFFHRVPTHPGKSHGIQNSIMKSHGKIM